MVVGDPVAEAVQNDRLHHGMIAVERVAAAAEVVVVSVRRQHVVDVVVETLEGDHGSVLVAFCRVIENDIEEALDPVPVQFADQFLQLIAVLGRFVAHRVAGVRREEADRIVSPVIEQRPAVHHALVSRLVEFKDRHQLHCVHPQVPEIRDLFHQSVERSRPFDAGGRMPREAADMKFIDDQILHRLAGKLRVAPVKAAFHDAGLVEAVLILLFSPDVLAGDRFGVDIEEHVFPVKPKAILRVPRAVQPVGVLKRCNIQMVDHHRPDVPDAVAVGDRDHGIGLRLLRMEEKQLTAGGPTGVNREIDGSVRQRGRAVQLIKAGTDVEAGDPFERSRRLPGFRI